MRKAILLFAVMMFPLMSGAQSAVNDLESDYGARFNLSVDKKLIKGLHLIADGQVRLTDGFSSISRWEAGLGLSYKINKVFRVGAGYTFIDKTNSQETWIPRHRAYVDGTATLRYGAWRFALKEKLQLTYREYSNLYEHNPYNLALKSRIKVSYKGLDDWTPYGSVEIRNVFNDPTCSATWNSTTGKYTNYSFTGYNDAYLNRVRGIIGTQWDIDKHNALDFYILSEYCYDKSLDVDKEGLTLKSLSYDQTFNAAVCIGYSFSF